MHVSWEQAKCVFVCVCRFCCWNRKWESMRNGRVQLLPLIQSPARKEPNLRSKPYACTCTRIFAVTPTYQEQFTLSSVWLKPSVFVCSAVVYFMPCVSSLQRRLLKLLIRINNWWVRLHRTRLEVVAGGGLRFSTFFIRRAGIGRWPFSFMFNYFPPAYSEMRIYHNVATLPACPSPITSPCPASSWGARQRVLQRHPRDRARKRGGGKSGQGRGESRRRGRNEWVLLLRIFIHQH